MKFSFWDQLLSRHIQFVICPYHRGSTASVEVDLKRERFLCLDCMTTGSLDVLREAQSAAANMMV